MTPRQRTNVHPLNARSMRSAAARLRRGELVAFPTETVYGLGANALDARAVAKIFAAKGRPKDNPMIVHVSDLKMLRKVAEPPSPRARHLMARFWPGPLTLILSKKPSVPSLVTAGLDTVAVRMPEGIARDLVAAAGVPIAAPSANISGRPSPTTAAHVAEDFPGVFVLDGGPTKYGVESTVVALEPPRILREGAIPRDLLRKIFRTVESPGLPRMTDVKGPRPLRGARSAPLTSAIRGEDFSAIGAASAAPNIRNTSRGPALSPGTKYKHYAPSRPLILFLRKDDLAAYFASHPQSLILGPTSFSSLFPKQRFLALGSSPVEIARALFAALRTRRRGSELLVLAIPRRGLGRTIMDRLTRAATRIV